MNINKNAISIALLSIIGVLGGCAAPKYSCPAPEHGVCRSVSDVYTMKSSVRTEEKNVSLGQAPDSQHGQKKGTQASAPRSGKFRHTENSGVAVQPRGFLAYPLAMKPGDPMRREARVIRLWIAPWVDARGDYYDQSYLYTEIDRGEWLIQERLRALQAETRTAEEVKHD